MCATVHSGPTPTRGSSCCAIGYGAACWDSPTQFIFSSRERNSMKDDRIVNVCETARAHVSNKTHRPGILILPALVLSFIGLVAFDIIMETNILARVPTSLLSSTPKICTPTVVNLTDIEYHSSHRYYDVLKETTVPVPVFRDDHTKLCDKKTRIKAKYEYCLPISGRKDTPFCAAADRMDLLNLRSSRSICYSSVLHMLLVEVYEELQATGNIPFLAFGSLLGAVRNGSMIPFTEDVDIGFVGEMVSTEMVRLALRKKGFHMFFMDIWRVCVAPTHPLAGHLYDPNLPTTSPFEVPYVDLYMMKQLDNGDWDMEELEGSDGRILPYSKVLPFSKVSINGMTFDTVHDPKYFLIEAYGEDYMTPKPRDNGDDSNPQDNYGDYFKAPPRYEKLHYVETSE